MQFLRGLVVSDDLKLVSDLDSLLSMVSSSLYIRKMPFPDEDTELETMVKLYAPAIVFLDMADPRRAFVLADLIQRKAPGVHVVGISDEATKERLLAAVRSGMRDVLVSPLTLEEVHRCLTTAFSLVEETSAAPQIRQQVITFLPAKVGSGTSTIALHTACTMARLGSARVALMDLDLDCGVIDFMLKLPFDYGLSQIAEFSSCMDESIWSRGVAKYGDLDVLRAGAHTQRRVTSRDMEQILAYARGNYEMICVDLPGVLHELSASAIEQSDLIFLVCTPDLPSVHLVRKRMALLRDWKLDSRTRIIYNRCQASSLLTKADVEDVLGAEVFAMIDNDYATLQQALMNGRPVDMDTPLGRAYTRLVHKILGVEKGASAVAARAHFWDRLKGIIHPVRKLLAPPNAGPLVLQPEIVAAEDLATSDGSRPRLRNLESMVKVQGSR